MTGMVCWVQQKGNPGCFQRHWWWVLCFSKWVMPSFSVFMGVLSIYYLYYQHIIYLSAHSQAQHCPPSPLKIEGMEEYNLNRVHQSSAHPTLPHGAKLGLSFGWINPVPPQNLRVPQCRQLVTTPEGLPDTCPKGLGSTWCPRA